MILRQGVDRRRAGLSRHEANIFLYLVNIVSCQIFVVVVLVVVVAGSLQPYTTKLCGK